MAFENRMLRGIFGPQRNYVTGDLRKFHIEELHNFCSSLNIIRIIISRRNEMGEACGTHERQGNCIRNFCKDIGIKETTRKT
jgi:hypothetical protein